MVKIQTPDWLAALKLDIRMVQFWVKIKNFQYIRAHSNAKFSYSYSSLAD
jgi:hypothetical protein